jgi:hypothetical protein
VLASQVAKASELGREEDEAVTKIFTWCHANIYASIAPALIFIKRVNKLFFVVDPLII